MRYKILTNFGAFKKGQTVVLRTAPAELLSTNILSPIPEQSDTTKPTPPKPKGELKKKKNK